MYIYCKQDPLTPFLVWYSTDVKSLYNTILNMFTVRAKVVFVTKNFLGPMQGLACRHLHLSGGGRYVGGTSV